MRLCFTNKEEQQNSETRQVDRAETRANSFNFTRKGHAEYITVFVILATLTGWSFIDSTLICKHRNEMNDIQIPWTQV
jgi:hypothetical protein